MTFQEAMALPERWMNAWATITTIDGHVIEARNDQVMAFTVDEGGQMPLGTAVSGRYTLDLNNSNGEWLRGGSILGNRSLTGARVQLWLGVWHDDAWDWKECGLFYVDKTSYLENDTRIKLTGFDSLARLDVVYVDNLGYPNTLNGILNNIRAKGFTINGVLVCNGNATIRFAPDWGEEPTVREVLCYVAQLGGCFVRCDRAGNIELASVHTGNNALINTETYLDYTDDERYFNFDRIKLLPHGAKKDAVYVEGSVGNLPESAANTIVVQGNPLFKTKTTTSYTKTSDTTIKNKTYYELSNGKYTAVPKDKAQVESLYRYYTATRNYNTGDLSAIVNTLKDYLVWMKLRAISFTWRGDPSVRIGDYAKITDTRGVTTETVILQQTLKYDQGFKSTVSCPLDLASVVPSTITSSGRVAPPYFGQGTIDGQSIMSGTVTGDLLVSGAVTAREVAAKTITADEIKAKAITADEIAAKTITADEIATGTITAESAIIADAAITRAKIADAAINTAKIENAAITFAKIGDAEIDTAKIKDAAIKTAKIGDAQITQAKIGLAAIGTAQIENAAITTAKIGDAQVDTAKIKDAAITTAKIGDAQVVRAKIGLAAIGTAQIEDAAITRAKIGNAAIGSAQIGEAVIGSAHIADASITNAKVVNLDAGKITTGTLDAGKASIINIDAGSITVGKINGVQIADGTVDMKHLHNTGVVQVIQNAQNTADGKNKVFYRDEADKPTSADGLKIDDLWFNLSKGYAINRWSGSAWVETKLGPDATSIIIGGTNLVRNSRNLTELSPWGSVYTPAQVTNHQSVFYNELGLIRIPGATTNEHLYQPLNTNVFRAGDQYTVSFWFYGSASVVVRIGDAYNTNVLFNTGVITPKYSLSGTLGWYYEATATISSETAVAPRLYIRFLDGSGNLYITRIKLEKGTVATDWSPAPEDVDALISNIRETADGKNKVYYMSTAPAGGVNGDLWFNTAKGYQMSVWQNGWTTSAYSGEAISPLAITTGHIASGAITAGKITAGAIETDKLAANAVTAAKVSANAIEADKIAAGAITASKIATGAVNADKIDANSVRSAVITAGSIKGTHIEGNTITGNKLVIGTVGSTYIADGAITTDKITAGAINADKIAGNTITGDKLVTNAITAREIKAGEVQAVHIQAGAIETQHISSGARDGLMITAQERIDLSVGGIRVGGRNLIQNSDFSQSIWSATRAAVAYAAPLFNDKNMLRVTTNTGENRGFAYADTPFSGETGSQFALSFVIMGDGSFTNANFPSESNMVVVRCFDSAFVDLPGSPFGMTAGEIKSHPSFKYSTPCRVDKTFPQIPAGTTRIRMQLHSGISETYIRYAEVQVEIGNKSTVWSPAPEDPAQSLKSSHILIEKDMIDISSGGKLKLTSPEQLEISSGKSIAMYIGEQIGSTMLGSPSAWQQGTLATTDGSELSGTTRIRTDFLSVTSGTTYDIIQRASGQTNVFWYTAAKNFISYSGWNTNSFTTLTAPATAAYARLLARKPDNSAVTTQNVPGYFYFEFKLSGGVVDLVQTSHITIDRDLVQIGSYGKLNLLANAGMTLETGANFNLRAGSGANEIGVSTNLADGLFIWGGGSPTAAKIRMWMNGQARFEELQLRGTSAINQFTQMYPYTFNDNAEAAFPATMWMYVPADMLGIQSLKLSFWLENFRAYSKGAASGGGSTSGSSGITTTNTIYLETDSVTSTGTHSHPIAGHAHNIATAHTHTTPHHTHPQTYGIYEGGKATSCTVVVDSVNIGAFSALNHTEISQHLTKSAGKISRGWHSIQLIPNALTRIGAQAFLNGIMGIADNASL